MIWVVIIAGIYTHAAPESEIKATRQKTIDYFLEVALGSEYGTTSPTIKKWESDIRIKVIGSPTSEDLKVLQGVIGEINILIDSIEVKLVDESPNLEIYFIPVSQFAKYEPNYKPSNYGFCWVGWKDDVIYKSRVLISTTGITQRERSHLIREELTQALGLMRDSSKYKESIFYADWTDSTQYAEIDKVVIRLLYSPLVQPGVGEAELRLRF